MKILIAPLNWGLGHATRCVPLIRKYTQQGDEVVIGSDGAALTLLRKTFPQLRFISLSALQLRYSSGTSQTGAILRAIPQLIRFSIKDYQILQSVLAVEHFDLIISDNRFGLFTTDTRCVYLTHQLHICLPRGFRWAEPLAELIHAFIYRHFDEVWVPDYPSDGLSGILGHPKRVHHPAIQYIEPLSRFSNMSLPPTSNSPYHVVALLSGLEPQRTLFEQEIIRRYEDKEEKVLLIQGLVNKPNTLITKNNITILPYINDKDLCDALANAQLVIARSGYSTIMDFHVLGIMDKAELHPTPGQSEQEYLAGAINVKREA